MSTDQTTEQLIQAEGANVAPRVTVEDIQANIADVEFVKHTSKSGQVLRWCIITARNGYAVAGRPSVSVSAENDRQLVGQKVAYENAVHELWPLMGYELRSKLATQPATFQDRVRAEAAELDDRVTKLKAFTSTETFGGLPVDEQERMLAQLAAMTDYSACLAERIQAFGA